MAQRVSRRRIAATVVDQLMAGEDRHLVMKRLAAYLVTQRLTGQIGLIMRSVEEVLAERGHVQAEVVSAHELSQELQQQLKAYLLDKSSADTLSLVTATDAKLLGGLIIRTPTHELDTSVRTTLRKLRNS